MPLQEFDCGSEAGWFLFEILITVWFIVWCKIVEGGLKKKKKSKKKKETQKDLNICFLIFLQGPVCKVLQHLRKQKANSAHLNLSLLMLILNSHLSYTSSDVKVNSGNPQWICIIHCQYVAMVMAASWLEVPVGKWKHMYYSFFFLVCDDPCNLNKCHKLHRFSEFRNTNFNLI